jgi:hypothetical protein
MRTVSKPAATARMTPGQIPGLMSSVILSDAGDKWHLGSARLNRIYEGKYI